MRNGRDRGQGFHPIRRIREWAMDDAHRWRRWVTLLLAALLAWVLCAVVTTPRGATTDDAPASQTDTIQSPSNPATGDDTDANPHSDAESSGGETNREAADRISTAMSGLLESTPDGRTSLADTVQPGGDPLTDDLEEADQQVTDLLKQAYATPDSTDLAGDLQDAYDAWESQVWLIANNDKLRAITSTLMTMSEQVTNIETMTGRPKECDRLVQVAHTLPEAGDTLDSYLEAHRWILDYNDAYAACTVALGEDRR